ncbi:MAG: hypothetical protein IJP59_00950 [Muribaculaceae bacterium]|nr:hypothetical protein [Muribaculaceae bacterium]
MTKLPNIILICVAIMVVACSHGSHQKQLVQVDSLLSNFQRDSAYNTFKQIDRDELSKADAMYYDVLKVALSQIARPASSFHFDISRDSVLDQCLEYYQQKNNQRMQLYSYLFKGKIQLETNANNHEASVWLKKAEELATTVNDLRLAYQTYEALATLNYYSDNKDLAMDYSYKTLACAQKSGNNHMTTYACNHLVVLYLERHERDSVRKYNAMSMSILNKMIPKDQSYALGNLGTIYLANNKVDSAKHYFERAIAAYPHPFSIHRLAEVYYIQGNYKEADSLWNKALQGANLRDKVQFYNSIYGRKYQGHDFEGATEAATRLLELKDSLVQQMQTAEVQEIQLKYDKEVEHRKLDRFIRWALLVALALISMIAGVVIYHIRKRNKARERIMRDQVLINDYKLQIEQLEHSGKDVTKEVKSLQKKIDTLQSEQTEKLSEGRELYQHVLAGESAVTWSKDNISKFVEYYKVVNLPFMLQMEQDYTKLSPGNKFFLILQEMGMTDQQMTYILGVSDGALRTTRSRLRQKRTAAITKQPRKQ